MIISGPLPFTHSLSQSGYACLRFISPFGRFYVELKEKSSLSLYLLPFTLSLYISLSLSLSLSIYISLSLLSLSLLSLSLSLSLLSHSLLSLSLLSLSLLSLSLCLSLSCLSLSLFTVKLVFSTFHKKSVTQNSFINLIIYLSIFFPLNAYLWKFFVLVLLRNGVSLA